MNDVSSHQRNHPTWKTSPQKLALSCYRQQRCFSPWVYRHCSCSSDIYQKKKKMLIIFVYFSSSKIPSLLLPQILIYKVAFLSQKTVEIIC